MPSVAADPNSSNVYATWFLPDGPAQCSGCPTIAIFGESAPAQAPPGGIWMNHP